MEEQVLLQRIRRLPPDKREAVEHFIADIERQDGVKAPHRKLMGALSHLNIHVTEQDIDDARREMWGKFPRSDF
jgi:hypothetical protein